MKKLNEQELKYIHEHLLILLKAFKDVCEKENIWYSLAYGSVLGSVRHEGFIPWDTDIDVFIMLPDKERFRQAWEKHKPTNIKLKNFNKEKRCLKSHDTLIFEQKMEIDEISLDIYPLVGAPSNPKEQKKFAKYSSYADRIIRSKYSDLRQVLKKNLFLVICAKTLDFFIPNKVLRKNIYKREHKYDFDTAEYVIPLSTYAKQSACLPKHIFDNVIQNKFEDSYYNIPAEYDLYLKRVYGDDYMTPKRY